MAGPSFERIALNRVTFGARNTDVALALRDGWPAWVSDQLAPPRGDDPDLDRYLRSLTVPIQYDAYDNDQLNYHNKATDEPARPLRTLFASSQDTWKLLRAIPWSVSSAEFGRMTMELASGIFIRNAHSKYQVREFLTDFWLNHFSISQSKGLASNALVSYDRDVIRPNVLGNFRQLLEAVASSASMLFYLDNAVSSAQLPNENYARELMELHTMGAGAYFGKNPGGGDVSAKGFTDVDIVEASRALSGWTCNFGQEFSTGDDGTFFFSPFKHNTKAGRFLGVDLSPYSGIAQGRKVLDLVANHPATAPFICGKLCRRIFGDTPPQSVLDRAVSTWIATRDQPDQIKRVMSAILLDGPEIGTGPAVKVRRPYERFIAMVRATDTILAAGAWGQFIYGMNDSPFVWPTPDGRPDTNAYWLTTFMQVGTWELLPRIAYLGNAATVSFAAQTPTAARQSADALVEYWVGRMTGTRLNDAAMAALTAMAAHMVPVPTEGADNWNNDFGRVISTIASAPEFVMR